MPALLAQLGIVCSNCDGFNEPGAATCADCSTPLAPRPAPAPRATPVPHAQAPAAVVKPVQTPPPQAQVKPSAGAPAARAVPPVPQRPLAPPPVAPNAFRPPSAPVQARPQATAVPQPSSAPGKTIAFGGAAAQAPLAPARPATEPSAKAPDRFFRVVVIRGSIPGSAFKLASAQVSAGRSKGLLIFPEDPFLAPVHAQFFYRDGRLFVRDEGTGSGTYVRINGPTPLPPNALFAAGNHLFRYVGCLPVQPGATPIVYGAPAPSSALYAVEQILEGARPGRACARIGPIIAIGRSGCELSFPNDESLNGRHCEVVIDGGNATLRDLGSPEGTFIRLGPGVEHPLNPGDTVRMGLQLLRIEPA